MRAAEDLADDLPAELDAEAIGAALVPWSTPPDELEMEAQDVLVEAIAALARPPSATYSG